MPRGPGGHRPLVIALALAALSACPAVALPPIGQREPAPATDETPPPPAPQPTAPKPGRALSTLPGWAEEDHLAALKAFRAGCGVAKSAGWRGACAAARAVVGADKDAARGFFESHFVAEPASPAGLLTAYYAPAFPAQDTPDEIFSAPVRPRPAEATDDPAYDLPRALIEQEPAVGAHAFMKAEDLFFLQIQGSGVLVFPDGRRMKAIYAGDNGLPFTPIARSMARAGLLPADRLSGGAIRDWLAEHRGPEADKVMDQDQRYIFFDLVPDDGREPAGAAGAPLTPGRAIAVDPAFHSYGSLCWIDADAPSLKGAVPAYRRLALALDTGSAIRGERRADLYIGSGEQAGQEAGRVRHNLELVRLIPIAPPINLASPNHVDQTPTEAGRS